MRYMADSTLSEVSYGGRPVRAWYSVAPSDQTSLASVAGWPEATSGARYAGDPVTTPDAVIVESRARAMPKSASFAVPSWVTSTFEGLTSRCTMPAACAAASASATCARSAAASSGSRPPDVLGQHGEVGAVDVLHHQPLLVPLADEVEHGHDVGVVELGGQLGLALGPHQVRRGAVGEQSDALDGHLTTEHLVVGQPDRAHAALADLASQHVAAADRPRWSCSSEPSSGHSRRPTPPAWVGSRP